jgi:hypothetical protein
MLFDEVQTQRAQQLVENKKSKIVKNLFNHCNGIQKITKLLKLMKERVKSYR